MCDIVDIMRKYWFKRKRYGWGWVPATWQGWFVLSIYMVLIFLGALFFESDNPTGQNIIVFVTVFVVATGLFIAIASYTAPKPKWRWGKKPSDNPNEDF